MKVAAHISTILAGYGAISLGLLKVFWVQFSVHFNTPGIHNEPQASAPLDFAMITVMIMGGIALVALRARIPMHIILITVCLYEFLVLHDGYHNTGQLVTITVAILGQIISLFLNLLASHSLNPSALKTD